MMPTKLKNISISEISSVDAGAAGDRSGRGRARVLLLKRDDNERENPMSESGLGVVSVAKRSAQALDEGTISQETYAKLQQRLAQEMFPNDTMGVALSKFFASPAGSEMLNRGLKKSYVDLQKRTALANADVLKAAKPAINTRADTSETAVDDDSDSDREEPWDKRVKALMDKHGIGQLQAESILHRAEKVRKNQSW